MSLFSVILFVILLLNIAKSDIQKGRAMNVTSSIRNFKEYMSRMIKEQSSKIQILLKKIELSAQTVLKRIRNMNEKSKIVNKIHPHKIKNKIDGVEYQIESPITENIKSNSIQSEVNGRSFGSHYVSTGYGASASANYGVATYHHHSIGFDPINIVVSMSLLSFLLQALQGILNRTRLPTPVVEAKSLTSGQIETWAKKTGTPDFVQMNSVYPKKFEYFKKKYQPKH
ncbi:unnamed protein product [Euphydryas editha]|uniref:Uncharacterized protein n=1 Tax=Euphydryas editha TaxID=104508 RepID=A0AAU9TCW0_EUPED|nr:unnamed protein product [Euphydryas editha]